MQRRYDPEVQFGRRSLVRALLAHDEDELAERVPTVTDDELQRIGHIAGDYAFPEEVLTGSASSLGTTRAISLAAMDGWRALRAHCVGTSWRDVARPPRSTRFAVWAFSERRPARLRHAASPRHAPLVR
jgi:hypothetical protein